MAKATGLVALATDCARPFKPKADEVAAKTVSKARAVTFMMTK